MHIDVRRAVWAVLHSCSQCQRPHTLDDFRVVGRQGDLWILTIQCDACRSRTMVTAAVDEEQLDIADSESEAPSLGTVETHPINVDDVLDMHDFLDAFDGDFSRLFARWRR